MTSLKLTPARLALLRAVERGEVTYWPAVMGDAARSMLFVGKDARSRTVTGAMEKFRADGLARLPHRGLGDYRTYTWLLTAAGREILAAHPEKGTSDG